VLQGVGASCNVWDSRRIADEEKKASRLDTMMPALIGVAGVVTGVLITAGITWLGDRSHRAGDKRVAERLIAKEIRDNTQIFMSFSQYGRWKGRLPQDGEWLAEAPILARYASSSTWEAVSRFYANVLTTERSLTKACPRSLTDAKQKVAYNARQEIRTDAKLGGLALKALGEDFDTTKRTATKGCPITAHKPGGS
jgi:hypothetical protein